MNRREILEAATQAVTVDRAATHGDPEDSFGLVAAYWSAQSTKAACRVMRLRGCAVYQGV